MKPVCQIYSLCLDDIPGYDKTYVSGTKATTYLESIYDKYIKEDKKTEREAYKKVLEKKQKIAGDLLFNSIIRRLKNKKNKTKPITSWFKTI